MTSISRPSGGHWVGNSTRDLYLNMYSLQILGLPLTAKECSGFQLRIDRNARRFMMVNSLWVMHMVRLSYTTWHLEHLKVCFHLTVTELNITSSVPTERYAILAGDVSHFGMRLIIRIWKTCNVGMTIIWSIHERHMTRIWEKIVIPCKEIRLRVTE